MVNQRAGAPWTALILIALAALGCSPPTANVVGSVTLDGMPLTCGTVVFHPEAGGQPAYGVIDTEGNYQLTVRGQAAAAQGDYIVTVVATAPPIQATPESMPMPGRLLTPARYGSLETSNLRVAAAPGGNRIDLPLTSQQQ